MKYRIIESKNNYDGKITWRVQEKFLWWWIYVKDYADDPIQWESYDRAKEYVNCELKRYSSHTDKVKEIL